MNNVVWFHYDNKDYGTEMPSGMFVPPVGATWNEGSSSYKVTDVDVIYTTTWDDPRCIISVYLESIND